MSTIEIEMIEVIEVIEVHQQDEGLGKRTRPSINKKDRDTIEIMDELELWMVKNKKAHLCQIAIEGGMQKKML